MLLDGLRLRVRSSRVLYRDQGSGRILGPGIRALEARCSGEALKLALEGGVDGEAVRLSGQTAPSDASWRQTHPYLLESVYVVFRPRLFSRGLRD